MRLLRVSRPEGVRNPEAYLFTIANHVLYQYSLKRETPLEDSGVEVLDEASVTTAESDPASEVELQQKLQRIDRALADYSPKAHAALILYRRDGYSLDEVASALGVSVAMVKKYLTKAILYCREQVPPDV